jgi:rhamnose transport system permease protein
VFLLGALQNVMSLVNVSAQSQIVVTGVLLVVSVLGPRVARQLSVARARRRTLTTAPAPPAPAAAPAGRT